MTHTATDSASGVRPAARVSADAFQPPLRAGLKAIKLGILETAERIGLYRYVRDSRWRSRRLLILGYHGISASDEHEWSPELYLPVDALRRRFELLRGDGFHVLPLAAAVERLKAGTLPARSISLTFDDGTQDFLDAGVPLLREFGFPATVYPTTYYAARQVPVFRTSCRYLLWIGRSQTISGEGLTAAGDPLTLATLDQRDAAVQAMEEHLAAHEGGVEQQVATLRVLAERVGADFDRFLAERRQRIMTPEDIGSLPRDLVDVQLHTHRHRVPLSKESFVREIVDNRAALSAWRPGEPFDAFCYPSGVTDERFLPWLRDLGIRTAVTCEPGLASRATDPLLLPRLVDSWRLTRLEFEAWLTGVGSFLPRVPRRGRYRPAPVYD